MTGQKHTIFPIKFSFNGMGFETKVLKYTYNHEVLYKIAMPSAISMVQQSWLSLNKAGNWNLIIGQITEALQQQIITAIKKQEHILTIYTEQEPEQELKSA